MESNNCINYIIDEVVARGYTKKPSDCNDFSELIKRKEFKDLIVLELYETYFWAERHEYDLQLLQEIIKEMFAFFNDPDTLMQIKSGFLQTLPSTIIVALVASIWQKIKNVKISANSTTDEHSSWFRMEQNIKKIDNELSNHDYILTIEIEKIFNARREEIQPLLKLCGCKCFFCKKKSIWIKAGTTDNRIREVLKLHNFKIK